MSDFSDKLRRASKLRMKEGGGTALDLSMVPYSTTTTEEDEVLEDEAGEVDTKQMEKNQRFIVEPAVAPVRIPTTTTTTMKESKVVVVEAGVIKYRECMRNHAASIGGHANDGCGEFMPPPLGGMKCVACGCHRNFHRREIQGGGGCVDHHRHRLHSFFPNLNYPTAAAAAAPTTAPIAPMPSAAVPAATAPPSMLIYNSVVGPNQRWEKRKIGGLGFRGAVGGYSSLSALSLQQHFHHHHHSRNGNQNGNGGMMFTSVDLRNHMNHDERRSNEDHRRSETQDGRGDQSHHKHYHRHHHHRNVNNNSSSSDKKRFRTKFSVEQKEKMVEFAEKVGWRLKREDDVALSEFCLEVGVKRHVLRVWMHNNKNTLRIRNTLSPPPPPPPPPLRHHPHDDAPPHHLDPHAPPPPPSSSSSPPPLAPPIIGV